MKWLFRTPTHITRKNQEYHDKNGGDSRIDLYYAGKSLIEETGLSSVDLISILYDKYKIPSNVQMEQYR